MKNLLSRFDAFDAENTAKNTKTNIEFTIFFLLIAVKMVDYSCLYTFLTMENADFLEFFSIPCIFSWLK